MKGTCVSCHAEIERGLFAQDLHCSKCGALLRVDNSEAKRFVYGAEAALIAIGFFSTSSFAYLVLAALMVVVLVAYIVWSFRAPLVLLHAGAGKATLRVD